MDALPIEDLGVKIESAIGATPINWPAGSTVQLCNVPWDSEYSNIVQFDDKAARAAYFAAIASESITIDKMTYCFPNDPVSINIEYGKAYTYNYLVVTNPKLPTDTQEPPVFYYFITNVIYVAPNTTTFELMLDVWTTYQFNVSLGRGFLERGHAVWHAYANNTVKEINIKKRKYLTASEGLDVGADYVQSGMELYSMGGGLDTGEQSSATAWTIVITSAVDLTAGFGTESNPKMKMADGMVVDSVPSGCDVYGMEPDNFKKFVKAISDYPWISTNILSITAMPEGAIIHNGNVTIAGVSAYKIKSQGYYIDPTSGTKAADAATETVAPVKGVDAFVKTSATDGFRRHPKAGVYPYSYMVADNMCGTPLTLKPELFCEDTVTWYSMFAVCPPFQKIFVFPGYYGAPSKGFISYDKYRLGETSTKSFAALSGYMLQNSLQWDDFPQFSILNDSYTNYLASNANTLKYQRDNAGWQLSKSKAGAQNTYDVSMRNIGAATEEQAKQRKYELTKARRTSSGAYLESLSKTAESVGSALAGDSLNKYIELAQNSIRYTTGRAASDLGQAQFDISKEAQTQNAGANYKLSMWAAKGDYQNAIAGINATCQDAALLPPTQSGTLTGGMYAVLGEFGLTNWYLYSYIPEPAYQKTLVDYWDRFGYAANVYVHAGTKLKLMGHFTYWKFQDLIVNTTGGIDETSRMVIKGIFEKGVTVYGVPEDISGLTDLIQEPLKSDPLY